MLSLSGFRNHSFRTAFWKRDCDFPECKNTDFFRFCNLELKDFERLYRKKFPFCLLRNHRFLPFVPFSRSRLFSTIACFMACILRSTSLFISPKNIYRDDAGSFHRHSSILSPVDKGRFHVQKIVKAAFFCCLEMSFIVRHITENPRPPARH